MSTGVPPGNKNANNVTLTIELPITSTSPNQYILGTLDSYSGSCNLNGFNLAPSITVDPLGLSDQGGPHGRTAAEQIEHLEMVADLAG